MKYALMIQHGHGHAKYIKDIEGGNIRNIKKQARDYLLTLSKVELSKIARCYLDPHHDSMKLSILFQ